MIITAFTAFYRFFSVLYNSKPPRCDMLYKKRIARRSNERERRAILLHFAVCSFIFTSVGYCHGYYYKASK